MDSATMHLVKIFHGTMDSAIMVPTTMDLANYGDRNNGHCTKTPQQWIPQR